MSEKNWRNEINSADFFLHQKKTLQISDRRPVIRQPSDLVGPGIDSAATPITDWNDQLATYNGYYSSGNSTNDPTKGGGALHAPVPDGAHGNKDFNPYVGFIVQDSVLGGQQVLYPIGTLQAGTKPVITAMSYWTRTFLRNPSDPDTISSIQWGDWKYVNNTVTDWVTVSGTGGPGFANGWTDFDARVAQFRLFGDHVELRGFIKSGTVGQPAFYLPPAYRPYDRIHGAEYWKGTVSNSAFGAIVLDTSNGGVVPQVGSNVWFCLDDIVFSRT